MYAVESLDHCGSIGDVAWRSGQSGTDSRRNEGNDGETFCIEHLGALLKSYRRKAA
jgi:hypothetical protein